MLSMRSVYPKPTRCQHGKESMGHSLAKTRYVVVKVPRWQLLPQAGPPCGQGKDGGSEGLSTGSRPSRGPLGAGVRSRGGPGGGIGPSESVSANTRTDLLDPPGLGG